ncbi:MAG: aminoacyl-tRNA hydrolase [Bacteroidetes bacterium]|nr:aminoacyl-tRNA hydrolase [Bacteroidota bacterium]MBS1540288.1 aminoacyl-tRNA hydrolase [Bacteroidota bacterium]
MTGTYPITIEKIKHELQLSTSRSSGPGGQNVNKVNTKVTVRWPILTSAVLTDEQKDLLSRKLHTRLTTQGELIISAQDKRTQQANKEEVMRKLEQLLRQAFFVRKKRKPTKPTKASARARVDKKKMQGEKKKWRAKF